jgi:hypothetical protein
MQKVTKERYLESTKIGDYYENLFKQKGEGLGMSYVKSSKEDDYFRHIDCYVNGYGVDVKGKKKDIWLEYTNINGNKGSLRGDAKYIAMFINNIDCFSIYFRKDLLTFIKENVTEFVENNKEYLKFYTRKRWGKKDLIVKVKYSHIKHLERKKL